MLELADVIAVNKADGETRAPARAAARELSGALRMMVPGLAAWRPPVLAVQRAERRRASTRCGPRSPAPRGAGRAGELARSGAAQQVALDVVDGARAPARPPPHRRGVRAALPDVDGRSGRGRSPRPWARTRCWPSSAHLTSTHTRRALRHRGRCGRPPAVCVSRGGGSRAARAAAPRGRRPAPGRHGRGRRLRAQARAGAVIWAAAGAARPPRSGPSWPTSSACPTSPALARRSDVIVSVCPPHAARAVAEEVARPLLQPPRQPLYVDANAVSPADRHAHRRPPRRRPGRRRGDHRAARVGAGPHGAVAGRAPRPPPSPPCSPGSPFAARVLGARAGHRQRAQGLLRAAEQGAARDLAGDRRRRPRVRRVEDELRGSCSAPASTSTAARGHRGRPGQGVALGGGDGRGGRRRGRRGPARRVQPGGGRDLPSGWRRPTRPTARTRGACADRPSARAGSRADAAPVAAADEERRRGAGRVAAAVSTADSRQPGHDHGRHHGGDDRDQRGRSRVHSMRHSLVEHGSAWRRHARRRRGAALASPQVSAPLASIVSRDSPVRDRLNPTGRSAPPGSPPSGTPASSSGRWPRRRTRAIRRRRPSLLGAHQRRQVVDGQPARGRGGRPAAPRGCRRSGRPVPGSSSA